VTNSAGMDGYSVGPDLSDMVGTDITDIKFRFVCYRHKRFLRLSEDGYSACLEFAGIAATTPDDSPNFRFSLDHMHCPDNNVDNDWNDDCADFYGVTITNDSQDWREPEDIT
jgi:hypothetical protein